MTPSELQYPAWLGPDMLNVAAIVPRARIHGPGDRFVLWLQGCGIRCKGCWNQQMWSFSKRQLIGVSDLASLVMHEEGISGVTILGGEPLHQRTSLISFVRLVKAGGLDVVLYTGYEMEELQDDHSRELVSLADMTICGRYEERLRSTHLKWRGSTNQRIIVPVGGQLVPMTPNDGDNEVEIHINDNGTVTVLGYPDEELLKEVRG